MTDDRIAIMGTRRAMKELVDGTIRVQIDIDPPYRQAFLAQFGAIDMPVAIVPIKPAAAQVVTVAGDDDVGLKGDQPIPMDTELLGVSDAKAKVGPLCKLACIWCGDPGFQRWIIAAVDGGFQDVEVSEEAAAKVLREICGITSRKYLDHDPDARATFDREIRGPYGVFLKAQPA